MELSTITWSWPFQQSSYFWLLILSISNLITSSASINCYTCSSRNGSEPWCEDPIDTTRAHLTEKCMVPKENHRGLFIANFCLKIVGTSGDTDERLVIRACALESMDSQCGEFKYENDRMSGCVLTCSYSGCNNAPSIDSPNIYLPLLLSSACCSLFYAIRLRNLSLSSI